MSFISCLTYFQQFAVIQISEVSSRFHYVVDGICDEAVPYAVEDPFGANR